MGPAPLVLGRRSALRGVGEAVGVAQGWSAGRRRGRRGGANPRPPLRRGWRRAGRGEENRGRKVRIYAQWQTFRNLLSSLGAFLK